MTDEQRVDLLKQIEKRIRIGGGIISFYPLILAFMEFMHGGDRGIVFSTIGLVSIFWLLLMRSCVGLFIKARLSAEGSTV